MMFQWFTHPRVGTELKGGQQLQQGEQGGQALPETVQDGLLEGFGDYHRLKEKGAVRRHTEVLKDSSEDVGVRQSR